MVEYDSEPSKVPKAMQEVPDAVYKATQEEFSSTIDILEKSKKCTMKKLVPPFVYIKTSSSMFVLGRNCVLETTGKNYEISEIESYKIKCFVHYYDFVSEEDLDYFPEIRKFGKPADYRHVHRDSHLPPKLYVKVIIQNSKIKLI